MTAASNGALAASAALACEATGSGGRRLAAGGVGLLPELMKATGGPPTGFALQGRVAIMSEGGGCELRDELSIRYHVEGMLNIAAELGIIERQSRFERPHVLCHDYLRVNCPATGQFYLEIEPGDRVVKGQNLGTIRDFFGEELGSTTAPHDGFILWRLTHATVVASIPILAVSVPA